MARLARGDVNMPNYDCFPIHVQIPEVKFEVAVYQLLRSEPDILASRLLYYRVPLQRVGPRRDRPKDILGRRLLVFERAEGEKDVWRDLGPEQRVRMCSFSVSLFANPLLGLPSYPVGSYPRIIVQLATPAWLGRCLAPRTPLRAEAQIASYSRCTHARVLYCPFHGQDRSDHQEHR